MIDPRFLDFQQWADLTRSRLPNYDDIPMPQAQDWKEWGMLVLRVPSIAAKRPPQPNFFDNWRDWAYFFNRALSQ